MNNKPAKDHARKVDVRANESTKGMVREGEAPAEPPLINTQAAPAEPPMIAPNVAEVPQERRPPGTPPLIQAREGKAPAEPKELAQGENVARQEPRPPSPRPPDMHSARQEPRPPDVLPVRHHPAHGIKDVDGQPTIIFDTLCTKDRVPALANDEFHSVFREVAVTATAWLMGRYVIMPDHIHFFAGDAGSDVSYENWVKYLKSQLTKALGGRGTGGRGSRRAVRNPGSAGASPSQMSPSQMSPSRAFRWQTDHWDSRVRNAQSYEEKWLYVRYNPVRHGLVVNPDDWPYQGEIFELRWD